MLVSVCVCLCVCVLLCVSVVAFFFIWIFSAVAVFCNAVGALVLAFYVAFPDIYLPAQNTLKARLLASLVVGLVGLGLVERKCVDSKRNNHTHAIDNHDTSRCNDTW